MSIIYLYKYKHTRIFYTTLLEYVCVRIQRENLKLRSVEERTREREREEEEAFEGHNVFFSARTRAVFSPFLSRSVRERRDAQRRAGERALEASRLPLSRTRAKRAPRARLSRLFIPLARGDSAPGTPWMNNSERVYPNIQPLKEFGYTRSLARSPVFLLTVYIYTKGDARYVLRAGHAT